MSGKSVFPRFVRVAVVAVTLLVALSARPARAASLVVDSAGDNIVAGDGACTLREAMRNANNNNDTTGGDCVAGVAADTITFDPSLSGATISLGSALPHVSGSLEIDGNGLAQPLTVDGADTYRVFHINAGAQFTLQTLKISNGGGSSGGGLYVEGSASVTKSTFSSNAVSTSGGAIFNAGSLTVTTSAFSANSAGSGGTGTGGGIHNAGSLTVTNSTFSGNSAGADGGGISNASNLTVTNNTFLGNSAPSGGGGALSNAGGTLAVTNSTFSGNNAGDGGGIVNTAGTLTVKNSTLSDNNATDVGGGIYINAGTFHYANTIIANSAGGDCLNNGTLGTNTKNLVEDGSCSAALSGDPALDALANNGGHTQTMALLAGSPAIDAGNDTACVTPPVSGLDQRGFPRPLGAHCDIGALENDHQTGTPSFIANTTEDTDDGLCDFYVGGKSDCTLREAINHANARSGADTITFDSILSGTTITIGSALPTLNGDVIIDGSAPTMPVTIDGDGTYRPFLVGSFTVTLKRLVIIDGMSSFGGAIFNDGGDLQVNDITFSGNTAIGGAGIWNNSGPLAVTNSTFSGNSASDLGGGIYNNGTLTLTNSTLSGNTAISTGGAGIYNEFAATATVSDSTFSANDTASGSGAGILNAGSLNVSASTLKTNTGSVYGGGIYNNDGTATVSNSTFSANSTGGNGGGIYNSGTLTLLNSTLSGNGAPSGGGVNNQDVLHLANTIIANSTNGGDCVNGASLSTNTHNLVEDGSCSAGLSGDPMLGPLADNGGPTQTMALLSGSIAMDAGDDTVCAADPVNNLDQGGQSRPIDGDGDGTPTCDIGAFEQGRATTTLITADTPDPSVPGQLVAVTVTVSATTGTPTGTVSISGADVNCAFTLLGGTGTCNVTFTSGGDKTVTATYSGDEAHAGSSDTEPHVVWFMKKFLSQSANDGWVLESSEYSNVGGTKNSSATTLRVGDYASDKQYRSILSFNTADLPDTAIIRKVMIYVKQQSVTGTNPLGTHGGLKVDIKQPYLGAAVGLGLDDFAAVAGRNGVCTIGTTPANNWYNGTFGTGSFVHINKTGTTQLRLRFATGDNNDNGADVLNLYSGNAVSSNRPYIIVYYTP
jgi:CSLREA domain-containing protein